MAAGFRRLLRLRRCGAAFGACAAALVLSAALTPAAAAQLFSDEEARNRLDDHQVQLRQLSDHIVELRKQGGAISGQLQALNDKLGAANKQLGRISQRLQKAEEEIRELRGAQQEQSESSRRARDGTKAAMETRVGAVEKQLAGLQELQLRELLDDIRAEVSAVSVGVAELYNFVQLPPEQELYDAAFAEYQERRYQEALDGFRRVQQFYPDGKFQVNVGYWISNALYALGDYEAVVIAARDLIARHPQSDKTPDAMLLMARALLRQGHDAEAKGVLTRLIEDHSTSLAADKARQEL